MSAVLLAVFERCAQAEQVRTELVRDGFPTDRVELTARGETGRAGLQPAESRQAQLRQYFRTLFSREDERAFADLLAGRVEDGAATTIAVHPRGDVETARAAQLLGSAGALELVGHDLDRQTFEHAAATTEGSWISHLAPPNPAGADCVYCRLFPQPHSH
jgi:hypothetical protein